MLPGQIFRALAAKPVPFARLLNLLIVLFLLFYTFCRHRRQARFPRPFTAVCEIKPVSYTHLDVYKRQGSLLSGASGAFHGFHPAAGLTAVLPQRIRKRKPPPYIPLRKSVPPQRAAPPAAIPRGTAPDTASAPRLLPPEKAKAPPEPRELSLIHICVTWKWPKAM